MATAFSKDNRDSYQQAGTSHYYRFFTRDDTSRQRDRRWQLQRRAVGGAMTVILSSRAVGRMDWQRRIGFHRLAKRGTIQRLAMALHPAARQ